MDGKKLHRLNKTELLWIIRDQEAELEELRAYVEKLGGSLDGNSPEQSKPRGKLQSKPQGQLPSEPQEELQKAQEELQTEAQEELQQKETDRTDQGGVS